MAAIQYERLVIENWDIQGLKLVKRDHSLSVWGQFPFLTSETLQIPARQGDNSH